MEQKILSNEASYQEVLDFLNSYENIDDIMLESLEEERKPEIKIISSGSELSLDYDNFLEIFDNRGLDAFVF